MAIVALIVGLGVFMAGVITLRKSLQASFHGKMKTSLQKVSKNRFVAMSTGALSAAIMHSSSAVNAISISLVDAGTLSLFGASAIILGANIGTTVTGVTAASGLLGIGWILGSLVFVGCLTTLSSKKARTETIGQALMGLGLIFVGMQGMNSAFGQEQLSGIVGDLFANIKFAPLLILVSATLTAIIQSSSAMVALTISMVASNTVPLQIALFVVLGADAGTCVTALIASVGTTVNAKRAAIVQVLFNVFGVVLFGILLSIFKDFFATTLTAMSTNTAMSASLFHVFFNISTVAIALPLLELLIKLSKVIVRESTHT